MEIKDGVFNSKDKEAVKILNDFLPDKIFDAHMHVYDKKFNPNSCANGCFALRDRCEIKEYLSDMAPYFKKAKEVRCNMIIDPDKDMGKANLNNRDLSTEFIVEQLDKYKGNVGEIIVRPTDTEEDIEKMLTHKNICGFKCYHLLADKKNTWNCSIGEYLPESAFKVADKHKLAITLHMVKDKALYDQDNSEYIIKMAKKYKNATLILAHAARSFASWTAIESVEKVAKLDNVWFDFSAVCESSAMFMIMKKAGIDKCMWGSDYPVSRLAGKAISLGDSFYWINAKDIQGFAGPTNFSSYLVGTENLMATRQALIMYGAKQKDIEKVFYKNAMNLFKPKD